jgi:hypothetical protein
MLNIKQINEIINIYQRNKGILKKITRTDHPTISATKDYLSALRNYSVLEPLSIQDLLSINDFFCKDFPVEPGQAAFAAWVSINHQHFCALNPENKNFKPNDEQKNHR